MRSGPDISLLPSLTFSSAPSIAASAGATSATKASPAAVRATLRVVRLKRRRCEPVLQCGNGVAERRG